VTEESGEICCDHCNGMAGLGETCTHIAAALFYVQADARLQDVHSVTMWLDYLISIDYQPISKIDFTSTSGKKQKIDEMLGETVEECEESCEESVSDECFKHPQMKN